MKTLNRALLAASAAACALAPAIAPQADTLNQPLALEDVRHALTRTSFGASPADLRAYIGQPRAVLVGGILDDIGTPDTQPLPQFAQQWQAPIEFLYAKNETLGELAIGAQYVNLVDLSTWWMVEAMNTDSPFKEQMAMFWMDHFVTSFEAHENAHLTAQKFQTVRATMGGSFRDMLAAQLRDPALLLYLNNVENTAEAPNENLGRELLELFTLGQGRGYTEADIREVSRALTGYGIEDATGLYSFRPAEHDKGSKTIFGLRGNFSAADLPDLILSQPAFGPYIVEKMWRYFISDAPEAAEVAAITDLWRGSEWDLPTLYRGILSTPSFWDAANRGTLVKSPWELYVGFNRTFGTAPSEAAEIHDFPLSAGQALFMPPNVAGWNEGTAWITDSSLVERTAALQDLTDHWVYDSFEPYDAPAFSQTAIQTETDGLRVGLVGLEWAWKEVEDDWKELGLALSLYDIGFEGQTYHSLSFFVGVGEGEGEREVYFGAEKEGCGTGCPLSSVLDRVTVETDEEGNTYHEVWINPRDASDGVGKLTASEQRFIAALIKAVPGMIAETENDATWRHMADEAAEEGLASPSFAEVQRASAQITKAFARSGQLSRAIPQAPALERGVSAQGSAGLPAEVLAMAVGTIKTPRSDDDEAIDQIVESIYDTLFEERAAVYQARLSETFAGPEQWLAAMPAQAQTSAGLEIALLPVRNPALATDDKAVEGLDDLLFSLVLDPRFHLK